MTCTIHRGEEDLEIEVFYTAAPIIPMSGPSWNDPGSPAEGGEIEIEEVTYGGHHFHLTMAEEGMVLAQIESTHDYDGDMEDGSFYERYA